MFYQHLIQIINAPKVIKQHSAANSAHKNLLVIFNILVNAKFGR